MKTLKKAFFLITIIVLSALSPVFSQTKIGLKFGPTFMNQRTSYTGDTLAIQKPKTKLRLYAGIFGEIPIGENYYFHTGLFYMSKSFDMYSQFDNDRKVKNEYRVQYLQVPALIKLYTNEVAIDKKIYFQIGPVVEFKIFDERKEVNPAIDKFGFMDLSLNISLGMEMQMGPETALFGGLTYQRGLLNMVGDNSEYLQDLSIRNDLIGLEVGIKF